MTNFLLYATYKLRLVNHYNEQFMFKVVKDKEVIDIWNCYINLNFFVSFREMMRKLNLRISLDLIYNY